MLKKYQLLYLYHSGTHRYSHITKIFFKILNYPDSNHSIHNDLSQLNVATQLRRLVSRQKGEAIEQLRAPETPFLHQELDKVMPTAN